MDFIKHFFTNWDTVQNVTLELIREIPADKLDFKPAEKSFTVRELVHHIYGAENLFVRLLAEKDEITMEDFGQRNSRAEDFKTVDDLYEYAKKTHENTMNVLKDRPSDFLLREIKTPFGTDHMIFHLNFVLSHLLHHRGQLYIYLRMCGVEKKLPMR